MIRRSKADTSDIWEQLPGTLAGPSAVIAGLCLTVAATLCALLLTAWLPPHGAALLYILAIVSGAVSFGVLAGLSAATFSFLAFNFFFVEPTHTFTISDPRDLFALLVFYGVAAATGSLAGRMREVAERARRRALSLQSLNGFAASLSGALSVSAVASALAAEAVKLGCDSAVVLIRSGDELRVASLVPPHQPLESSDWQAAQRSERNRETIYPSAAGWPGASYEFRPVLVGERVMAVLGLRRIPQAAASREDNETLEAMLQHAAIAFDRIHLEMEKAESQKEIQAEKLRSALLSSVSHDLKTPLASIQGAVTSLRELGPRMPDEARADLLLAIEEETARLSRFVTNLLDMTRIEANPPNLLNGTLDLEDIVWASIQRARRLLPSARIDFASDTNFPLINGDAILFEHAVLNLVENAAKFSPAGAPVSVKMRQVDDTIELTVEDQGQGIPKDELPKVFDKFFRGRRASTVLGTGHGTGLGLTICKRIVEGMRGSIAVESPAPSGHGTRVTIRFPVQQFARPSPDINGFT